MIDRKNYIERIKQKLDEWDDELERLEQEAASRAEPADHQLERHRMELHAMLMEMQDRIDELRDEYGGDAASMSQADWQTVSRDLEILTERLYPAN